LDGHYNPPCPPYGVDFHIGCLLVKIIQEKFSRIVYVTDRVGKEHLERMGFTHASSLDEALTMVKRDISNAEVTVLPAGGITLPVLVQ
jgi:hypothetical protein